MSATRHDVAPAVPPAYAPPAAVPVDAADAPADSDRLVALVVLAAVLAAGIFAITPHPLGVFADDAMYAVLARSLAEGKGFRFINLPGEPSGTHFPPVYPALLALLWKLYPAFPQNVLLFKAANAVLNAVAALLAFRFGERRLGLPRPVAAAAGVLAGVAIPSLLLAGMVLSEPLFLAMLLAALPFAERVRSSPTVRGALLLGATGGVLMLTRSIGLAFIVGTVAALLLARRWRHAALVAAAAASLALPWQWWIAAHDAELPEVLRGKYGSYSGWLSEGVAAHGPRFLVRTVLDNVNVATRMVAEPFRMPVLPWSMLAAGLLGVLALAAGTWRLARRAPVTFLVAGAYLGIVLLWPFDPTRFLWGVWPLVVLLVVAGGVEAWSWLRGAARAPAMPRRVVGGLLVAASAFVFAGGVANAARGYHRGYYSSLARRREATALPVLLWTLEHTSPTDVVASDEEAMIFLYTGRLGMPVTRFTASEHMARPDLAERSRDLEQIVQHYRPDWLAPSAPASAEAARELARRAPHLVRIVDTLPPRGLVLRSVDAND